MTSHAGFPEVLYRNHGNGNHWISFKPVGTRSNRPAIGAKVRVRATIFGESLPDAQRNEVVDFARFLATRQDDERWESLLAYPERRPKLDAFLRESAAEAEAPLDPNRL